MKFIYLIKNEVFMGRIFIFLISLLICASYSIDRDVTQNEKEILNELINEAKNIFELEVTRTPSVGGREGFLMQLGTMTPVWSLSKMSLDKDLSCIDVPKIQ